MHICDKCKKYNKCYPMNIRPEVEEQQRAEVELGGCPTYKELTIEEMFAPKRKKANGPKANKK